jgi:hypothetical protein
LTYFAFDAFYHFFHSSYYFLAQVFLFYF